MDQEDLVRQAVSIIEVQLEERVLSKSHSYIAIEILISIAVLIHNGDSGSLRCIKWLYYPHLVAQKLHKWIFTMQYLRNVYL